MNGDISLAELVRELWAYCTQGWYVDQLMRGPLHLA